MQKYFRAALIAASLALPATQAFAHITLENPQARPGASWKGVVRIGHGCDGTATTTLKISIPEGLVNVKPMPKAGWKLEILKGKYAAEYTLYGEKLGEGVQQIIWSGGNLPDDFYDEFVFSSTIAPGLPLDKPLYLPVVQECEKGASNWVQIPGPGQEASALKAPAPFIRLVAGPVAPVEVRLGTLVISQPWARATPAGAPVAGGYIRVTNTGEVADRLVGGSTDIARAVELHEMKTEDGVMKMRPLPDGLVIEPGQTVELKPGGLHLMFPGLKRQLKQGESFKVTLVFEKAGPVTLDFRVEGMGAQGAGAAGDEHAGH